MKKNWLAIVLMIIIIPLAGELKFFPFAGEFSTFRVSFGSPAFLFFLLWLQTTPMLLCGFLAGLAVLVFRMLLDWTTGGGSWAVSLYVHFPAFFYYVIYAMIFYLARAKDISNQPLRIAGLSIVAEIFASMVELLLSPSYVGAMVLVSLPMVSKILIIAVIRSFFVLSFFFIMRLRHAEFVAEQQIEQNKHTLMLISSMYEELVQLKKSLQNAESITRDCYTLYKGLQNKNPELGENEVAQNILTIAGQVHEIKKDNQRIYASLTRLISDGKFNDYMNAAELADIIVQAHQKYARALHKNIHFGLTVEEGLPSLHVYTVLSLISNLVSNAIEASKEIGQIRIIVSREKEWITFQVADDGPGIPANKRNLVFKPGYTTKFDLSGNPSTGMGLSYIKDLANSLHGSVILQEQDYANETVFIIKLPLRSLIKEG